MSRDPRPVDRNEDGTRKQRVPLGVPRNKMMARAPDGYVGRWINDEDNRLHHAQEGGWTFVRDKSKIGEGSDSSDTDLGLQTSMLVGTNQDGTPLRAYWMLIKKEWYEADQREKLKPVDEIEKAIKRGKYEPTGSDLDTSNTYVPKSGIKIQ